LRRLTPDELAIPLEHALNAFRLPECLRRALLDLLQQDPRPRPTVADMMARPIWVTSSYDVPEVGGRQAQPRTMVGPGRRGGGAAGRR
jgi:hypothetical protein